MKIHQLSISDALTSMRTSVQGLDAQEAAARLKEYGPNQVQAVARQHWALRLLAEFTHLFAVILWVAAALAFVADWYTPHEGMARVGVAVVIVIILSGLFSFWQEARVERTLAALQSLLPSQVGVLRGGVNQSVPAAGLVPGDVIPLRQGDNVPADCRLIEAFGVRVNRATVTGESHPQHGDASPSKEESHFNSHNILLAGTSLVTGKALAVVFATGARTEFGRIAQLTQTGSAGESPLRREIDHLSRSIAWLSLGIGAVFFALGFFIGVPFWRDVILSLGIIVALVPEGLQPTLTLSLVLAAQRLAKRKVLIRHLPSVETLGSVTVICTDKTGTLTQNRMTVKQVFLDLQATDIAALNQHSALLHEHAPFFSVARHCQDLAEARHGDLVAFEGDPLEIALADMSERLLPGQAMPARIDEHPFDSDRMRHSVLYPGTEVPMLYCKGALESVLPRCESIAMAGHIEPLTPATRSQILQAQEHMAAQGLRVIALATRRVPEGCARDDHEQALTFCGLASISDPPRPDVDRAIASCHTAGIKVIMVTGDHPRTAQAIAQQIGLIRGPSTKVITGEALSKLAPAQLQLALDEPDILFARVAADQKMRIVQALQNKGHIVAVTGDGVNDAPALKAAHIGIAMGLSGTDVAKEAADMVLLDDHFASIVHAIEEGRAVFQNIRKFLTYVLVHNVAELVPYLAFAMFPIPLPLTPIQSLTVDMGTDSITALGLGVEKGKPQDMQRPPRARTQRLLNGALAMRAYLFLGLIEAAAAMSAFFHVLGEGGWRYGDPLASSTLLYKEATTACLAAIVLLQIVNVFVCRSAVRSIFTTGLGGNALILWGALFEGTLLGVMAYTSWGNALFDTAPLPLDVWLFLAPWAVALVALEEGRKAWARRRLAA
jgi:sodium/potassium-transporting ATPase subunit alpha